METAISHFRDGGWAMFLVLAAGLMGLGAAGRFAWRGEHQLLGFIRWNLATLLFSGLFGACIGMMNVLAYIQVGPAPDQRLVVLMEGTREVLNNPSAALMFALLVTLLTSVGMRRFPQPNPSAVPR